MQLNLRSPKNVIILFVIILLILILSIFGFCYSVFSYGKIYPNVKVAGVDVGERYPAEAQAVLEEAFADFGKEQSITLKYTDIETPIDLDGYVWVDSAAASQKAYLVGREGNVFRKLGGVFSAYLKRQNIPLSLSMDNEYIKTAVEDMAAKLEDVSKFYTVDKTAGVIHVDIPEGAGAIDKELTYNQVAQEIAENRFEDINVTLADLSDSRNIDLLYQTICTEPKNATITVDGNGAVNYIPDEPGVSIDKEALKKEISSKHRKFTVPATFTAAEVSLEQLKKNSFADVLGQYSSPYDASLKDRTTNVRLSAEKINNVIVPPGGTFSYNTVVGERTEAKGYRNARVFIAGRVEDGLAGGICQTSSTLHAAVLYADLQIVRRTNHQFIVSYAPSGMDATVAYGSLDYVFKNNKKYPIKVTSQMTGNKLVVKILGTKTDQTTVKMRTETIATKAFTEIEEEDSSLPAGQRKVTQSGQDGATVNTYKIYQTPGQADKEVFLYKSVYIPMDKIIKVAVGGKKGAAATPTPTPTPQPQDSLSDVPASAQTSIPVETANPTVTPPPVQQEEPTPSPKPSIKPTPKPEEEIVDE